MKKRIIYQNDEGGMSVLIPADCGLTLEQIAAKDVPAGKPYKIVDAADIPEDREARDVSAFDLSDGFGADYGAGSENVVFGWTDDGDPVTEQPE